MKKTKIVCTIGPASESVEVLEQLIKSGMNAARLNFSHGDYVEHGRRIDRIKRLREKYDAPVAIILDTKGPEIRTGDFVGGEVELTEGHKFTFTTRDVMGDTGICSVSYKGLAKDLKPGNLILVNDGIVGFRVDRVEGTDAICTVMNSGSIGDHKGVNVSGAHINLPAITEKDIDDILFGIKCGVDMIAASFIREAADVVAIRRVLDDNGGKNIAIISKIETREGVENLDEIIKFSNGIMVARGDLGVELPVEEIPIIQKCIIEKCNRVGKPVITATQMLDSMIRNPRPTRAEATDVANAIFDGTDCLMLSGETANGRYPVESVKTMARIAERTERSLNYPEMIEKRKLTSAQNVPDAISYSACTTAAELGAKAIITATMTGHTARRVAKFRPSQAIIAVTPYAGVARKLSIVWGVYPSLTEKMESSDDVVNSSIKEAMDTGIVGKGDLVVIAAGVPIGFTGTTNMLKVHIVGDVLLRGRGSGAHPACGKAVVIDDDRDASDSVNEGDILVVRHFYNKYMALFPKAAGIVVEESGLSSDAVVECINRGVPIITGADGACTAIKSGMMITLDVLRGLVFSGRTNV